MFWGALMPDVVFMSTWMILYAALLTEHTVDWIWFWFTDVKEHDGDAEKVVNSIS